MLWKKMDQETSIFDQTTKDNSDSSEWNESTSTSTFHQKSVLNSSLPIEYEEILSLMPKLEGKVNITKKDFKMI